jgi:hypothetical protein
MITGTRCKHGMIKEWCQTCLDLANTNLLTNVFVCPQCKEYWSRKELKTNFTDKSVLRCPECRGLHPANHVDPKEIPDDYDKLDQGYLEDAYGV